MTSIPPPTSARPALSRPKPIPVNSPESELPVKGSVPDGDTTAVGPTVVVVVVTSNTLSRVVEVGCSVVVVGRVVVVEGSVVGVLVLVLVLVLVDVVGAEVDVVVERDVEVTGTDVLVVLVEVVLVEDVEVLVLVDVEVLVVELVVSPPVVVLVVPPPLVVVVVAPVVVVVAAMASGSVSVKKTWSVVEALLFVETRNWQFLKLGRPFCGSASFGDRQLKSCCGLESLNGLNWWFRLPAGNVTVPVASAVTAAFDRPRSQSVVTSQNFWVEGMPSHCSASTDAPAGNPVATTVNGTGLPSASPGTTNGVVLGVVMLVSA